MAWNPQQQYRLAVEKRILDYHMPDFQFHHPTEGTSIQGWWTSSRGNRYRIVVTLPDGFPDECPDCYIADPAPLQGLWKPMTDYGNNHEMHTWETDRPPWTLICTYRPRSWSASHSIEKVLQKAMLWLEAYESHLETAQAINKFLLDMG